MASNNPYRNINIDRTRLVQTVGEYGGVGIEYRPAGGLFHLTCQLHGQPFKMAVYENKGGTTTLSSLPPTDKTVFEGVAAHILATCAAGNGGRFDFSTQKFPPEHVEPLLEFLQEGATIEIQREENGYCLTRLRGNQGDSLTLKLYRNGTLQLQGRRAMLAAHAQDYLMNVLSYADAVRAQMETFAVPVTLQVVEDETAGRLPHAFSRLDSKVGAQLTSAIALTKVNLPLSDYGAVAFPALRGLEGFMKTELGRAGLGVANVDSFGEYFAPGTVVGRYVMRSPAAETVGAPLAASLVECYTLYARERHGIVHMSSDPETSRVLESLDDARRIVFAVIDTIEGFCRKLPR